MGNGTEATGTSDWDLGNRGSRWTQFWDGMLQLYTGVQHSEHFVQMPAGRENISILNTLSLHRDHTQGFLVSAEVETCT